MNVNDLYLCPKALEDLAHDVHVCDVGDVAQGRHPWRHDGGSHELERRVLRALDGNLTSYGVTALNLDDVQESSVTRRSGFRRLASGEGYTT